MGYILTNKSTASNWFPLKTPDQEIVGMDVPSFVGQLPQFRTNKDRSGDMFVKWYISASAEYDCRKPRQTAEHLRRK